MAVTNERNNEIISLSALNDVLAIETTPYKVDFVYIVGTGAGVSTLQDSNGNLIATAGLTTSVLNQVIPVNRSVNGFKASALASGHVIYIYLKKA
jgi:hypothetical protein